MHREEVRQAHSANKGHGRIEKRFLECTDMMQGWPGWPGLTQVCRMVRKRTIRGKTSVQEAYAITSLSPEKASAAFLLALSRQHWGIENRLFCVRDITFREDQCRARAGSGPQAMAAIRNMVITILKRLGFSNLLAAREHYSEFRTEALELVRYGRTK